MKTASGDYRDDPKIQEDERKVMDEIAIDESKTRPWVTDLVKGRALGCMYGLLVGDALGAPFEFMDEGTYEVPEEGEYASGGMHGVGPGEWTDDGAMALALADSLASVGWDRSDQLDRYLNWMYHGEYSSRGFCFDIGVTTSRSLDRYAESGDPDYAGKPLGRRCAGNGSIMRLAPVPVWCALTYEKTEDAIKAAERLGRASSTTTHGHRRCVDSAGALSKHLCRLIRGEVSSAVPPLGNDKDPRKEGDLGVSGYVVDTLNAALWCCSEPNPNPLHMFGRAVRKAVSLGGDTDTVGAVTGQIAGAKWGVDNIPSGWLLGLEGRDIAQRIITRLVEGD